MFFPFKKYFWSLRLLLLAGVLVQETPGFTLQELRSDTTLTPEGLIRRFADFKFELGEDVQSPENFLASRSGDCDDFATLAADILRERGYSTHLVVVFMPRDVHVVCYVKETGAYLDFNLRSRAAPLVATDGSLSDIALKVARSFRSSWYCASEFRYRNGRREFVYTDFPLATN
jgi:hypothetical protein